MNRKDEIQKFIKKFKGVPEFVHTTKNDNVYYSGPYYDEKELAAIIDSVMFGGWFSSGAKVKKFEQKFSSKFERDVIQKFSK